VGPDDPLAAIVARVDLAPGNTFVLAITGGVAAGKTTLADRLARALRHAGRTVDVVSTDGFLHPNAELERRGLITRKGFPETYDLERLDALVAAARARRSPLEVPVYSHERYDVEEEPRVVDRPDVLVVEGVIALQRRFGELGVYIDAAHIDIERWFVERFQQLVRAAGTDSGSFYRLWVGQSDEAVAEVARAVWDGVNLPNLVEHIEPTRDRADLVVVKGPDHAIREVRWSSP
jgi:type I pantothenate kinase